MSAYLQALSPADWASPYEHLDPDGDALNVPADEQPVRGWDVDDEYRDAEQ